MEVGCCELKFGTLGPGTFGAMAYVSHSSVYAPPRCIKILILLLWP